MAFSVCIKQKWFVMKEDSVLEVSYSDPNNYRNIQDYNEIFYYCTMTTKHCKLFQHIQGFICVNITFNN